MTIENKGSRHEMHTFQRSPTARDFGVRNGPTPRRGPVLRSVARLASWHLRDAGRGRDMRESGYAKVAGHHDHSRPVGSGRDVNAGEKLHRRAGVKMHHG